MFSNCGISFLREIGKLFTVFPILDAGVSHGNKSFLSFSKDFKTEPFISLIFLLTVPFMLCPPTGHNLNSALTLT